MKHDLPLWAEVDLGRIRRNVHRLKAMLEPGTKLLAVVKANAYGHGDVEPARAAVEGGAEWLGVARVSEGVTLRQAGIEVPILLLAEPPEAAVARAAEFDLVPTLYTQRIARAFDECGAANGDVIRVHVKVDTGMHRYGVAPEEAGEFVEMVEKSPGLELEGIWSHFAVAEDVVNPFTKQQLERFLEVLESLGPRAGGLIRHLSNSAATITLPESHFDMVRAGIAVYGIHPSPELAGRIELEPAMSVKARVGLVKRLRAGESLSYGQLYTTRSETTVATVPCGYADGLSRALSNRGEVLIGGRRYRISGAITMDHFLIDLGGDEVEVGDEVVLLGSQGSEKITAQEVAGLLGTIPYEIVCAVSARVPRVYLNEVTGIEAAPPE